MKSFTFLYSAMPKVFQKEYEMQVAILPQVPPLSFEISEKFKQLRKFLLQAKQKVLYYRLTFSTFRL